MTTIAIKHGMMAADSRVSLETEAGGARMFRCEKLYRIMLGRKQAIVGLAGGSFDGLEFLDWLIAGKKDPPQRLIDGDAAFTAVVLTRNGLFEYDRWCRADKILEPFYAVGSGAKAALGAMHAGASAQKAVQIACKIDYYSGGPVTQKWLSSDKSVANDFYLREAP